MSDARSLVVTAIAACGLLLFPTPAFSGPEDCKVAYVAEDWGRALDECRLAAEQGDATAQVQLAFMYEVGFVVAQDYAEALRWYRAAAEQGNTDAQFSLAIMYRTGAGVAQDLVEGARWTRMTADLGEPTAQFTLGRNYWHGLGVPQDSVLAHMWLDLAATQGLNVAKIDRDRVAEEMTPAQIAMARRLAKEWPVD